MIWLTTRAGKKICVEPQQRIVFTEAGDYVKGYEAHIAYCPKSGSYRRH